jgi:hypothetical protein
MNVAEPVAADVAVAGPVPADVAEVQTPPHSPAPTRCPGAPSRRSVPKSQELSDNDQHDILAHIACDLSDIFANAN